MTSIGSNMMPQKVTIARQSLARNEHGTTTFKKPVTSRASYSEKKLWAISSDKWISRMEANVLLPPEVEISIGDMVTLGEAEKGRPAKDVQPVYDGQGSLIAWEVTL